VNNKSLLYFLAVGVLSAAPALADRVPEGFMEHEGKSVSMHGLPSGYWFRDAGTAHKSELGGFKFNAASHLRDFDEDGKLAIMNGESSGHGFRDADTGHKIGLGAFKFKAASHVRDFDEDGKLAIMNGQLNAGSSERLDELNFLPRASVRNEPLGKAGKKDLGRPHPVDVDDEGSSLPPVVVAEPEAFTLVLVGVSVLGLLLYRRNLA